MSDLLVSKTSQTSQASTDAWAEVDGLSETVVVGSASSVLLLIATLPIDQSDSDDEAVGIRFAIDDVREGPERTILKDAVDEGCGGSLCYVVDGLSGSHKFALHWQSLGSRHANTDTGRVRGFQVIEIANASIIVNQSSQAADDAVAGFTDIVGLTATPTVAAGSVLLVLTNHQGELTAGEWVYDSRLTIGGAHEGPQLLAFNDNADRGCGQSMMWFTDGHSGSVAFAAQWAEIEAAALMDTGRVRTLQVVEITALVNLLTQIVSQAADDLEASYTDIVDLVDTVNVDAPESILLFAAGIPPEPPGSDACGAYRFHEGGTPEGPEQYIFFDNADPQGCGHSIYHAATGKSAGPHTFSLRGQNVTGSVSMDTTRNRSLAILELLVPTAALAGTVTAAIDEADIVTGGDTIILTLTGEEWLPTGAAFDGSRQDIIDGLESLGGEPAGWNAEVLPNIPVGNVVRTSATVVTITLPAVATYDITAAENVVITIPGSALAATSVDIPTAPLGFNIDAVGAPVSAAITVFEQIGPLSEADIRVGGKFIIITMTSDTFVAAGAAFDAVRQAIIDGIVASLSPPNGWNDVVGPAIPIGNVIRQADPVVTVELPAVPSYQIEDPEIVEVTVPASALVISVVGIVGTPTLEITTVAHPRRRRLIVATM